MLFDFESTNKSYAFLSINLNALHVTGMTHFDLDIQVQFLRY